MAALLNLNIVLAEDDSNDAILIERAFKRLDCLARLVVVSDGEEAISYLRGEAQFSNRLLWPFPGVVILDQFMPKLLGLEVLCWIRTEPRFTNLPVVLLSGDMPPSEAAVLGRLKAAYCPKCIGLAETIKSLNQAIADALALARGGWFRAVAPPAPSPAQLASLGPPPGHMSNLARPVSPAV